MYPDDGKSVEELLNKADDKRERAYSLGHLGVMTQVVAVGKGRERLNDSYYRESVRFMAAPNDHLYQATFKELHDEANNIDGILVSPLSRVFEWKQRVATGTDLVDIALLENSRQGHYKPLDKILVYK